MRRRWGPATTLSAAAILGMLWFLGAATPAHACSCMALTEAQHDAEARTIILGRVTDVEALPAASQLDDQVGYTVRVESLLKGEVLDPAFLVTHSQSTACGAELRIGDVYKLYPRPNGDGDYSISSCDGHRPATEAELAALDIEVPPPAGDGNVALRTIIGGLLVVGAAAASFAVWRRRPPERPPA